MSDVSGLVERLKDAVQRLHRPLEGAQDRAEVQRALEDSAAALTRQAALIEEAKAVMELARERFRIFVAFGVSEVHGACPKRGEYELRAFLAKLEE